MNFSMLTNLNSIIADIICIVIFLIFAWICSKKGFCKCVTPIVVVVLSFVTAIFGSIALEKPVAQMIYPLINAKMTDKLAEIIADIQSQSAILGAVLGQIDMSKGLSKMAEAITDEFVHIALFIVLLLLAIIVFGLLGKIAGKMAELPLIKSIDGFLGFIYGLLQGFVVLFIAVKICNILNIDILTNYSAETHILQWIIGL